MVFCSELKDSDLLLIKIIPAKQAAVATNEDADKIIFGTGGIIALGLFHSLGNTLSTLALGERGWRERRADSISL
jgi:hypothetical protein